MAEELSAVERQELIQAIANREGTAQELADRFDWSVAFLEEFTKKHIKAIRLAAELGEAEDTPLGVVTPQSLGELWISNKTDRLTRYQNIADKLYEYAMDHAPDATVLREFRFYLMAVANELGQLLHRGSGESVDGDKLQVEFTGINPRVFE
jgi:DNA-directed RNA polymerase sigma subunit (sigma70/sigma32)